MAERFFNQVSQDVEAAAEQLWSLFSNGDPTTSETAGADESETSDSGSFAHEFDTSDIDFDDLDFDNLSEEQIQQLLAEDMFQNNPLQGIAADVTKNIMAGQVQPETPMEHFHAFRSAIRWSENFIIGLICFQIIVFLLCFYVSRKDRGLASRVSLLVFIAIIVRSAERLNALGAEHWESFATQDYFDKRGVFVGIMLCAPLLLDSLMMLIFYMKEASTLLVQVKRNQIQQQRQNGDKGDGKKKKTGSRAKTKKQD